MVTLPVIQDTIRSWKNRQRRMNQSLARKKNHAKTDENGNILYSKNYQKKQVRKYQKVMAKVKKIKEEILSTR
ncbi:hypothetical protein GCM10020331_025340 [Ectobacillus funiculus]